MTPIESYIRTAAIARGIDPDIAVRVAEGEGGLTNPTQQSNVVKNGRRETSYGPFQLRIGGGVGDQALAQGVDPRKESDWQKGVDIALDVAAKDGWRQWYGAANNGIGRWDGIGANSKPLGVSLASAPVSAPAAAAPAGATPTPEVASGGMASVLQQLFSGGGGTQAPRQSGDPAATQISPSAVGASTGFEGAEQAATLMAALMADRKKRQGISLMGGPNGV